jgi:hypothetical protein
MLSFREIDRVLLSRLPQSSSTHLWAEEQSKPRPTVLDSLTRKETHTRAKENRG